MTASYTKAKIARGISQHSYTEGIFTSEDLAQFGESDAESQSKSRSDIVKNEITSVGAGKRKRMSRRKRKRSFEMEKLRLESDREEKECERQERRENETTNGKREIGVRKGKVREANRVSKASKSIPRKC